MISYCFCAYRPKYDLMLIQDLIDKTTVPYEILIWINTKDPSVSAFIQEKVKEGKPIKVIGWTPDNIGMNAFKHLFKAAQYEMIAQIDDDVLRVSPNIAEKAKDIFDRHPPVRMLVADVWQGKWTNGARPGMDQYELYNGGDSLYNGPIDSWFGIYHRSILPILMQAPYDRYFYLGSFVRGMLQRENKLGLLCTKFKVLHACGPFYHYAHDLLDHEIAKFRLVGMDGMAESFERAKAGMPEKEKIMEEISQAKNHIDSYPSVK